MPGTLYERPAPQTRGRASETRYLLWDGVVFERVGTRDEVGLPPEAFPLERRPVEIDVKKLSDESAKRFRGRR